MKAWQCTHPSGRAVLRCFTKDEFLAAVVADRKDAQRPVEVLLREPFERTAKPLVIDAALLPEA